MTPLFNQIFELPEAERRAWLTDPNRTPAELAEVANGVVQGWLAEDERVLAFSTETDDVWLTDDALAIMAALLSNPSIDEREGGKWLLAWADHMNEESYDLDRSGLHWLWLGEAFAKNPGSPLWMLTGALDETLFAKAPELAHVLLLHFPSLSSSPQRRHLVRVGEEVVRALRSPQAKESMEASLYLIRTSFGVSLYEELDYPQEDELRRSLNSAWNVWVDQDFKGSVEGRARLFLISWLIYGFSEEDAAPWRYPALRDLFIARSGMEWPLLADGSAWKVRGR